MMQFTFSDDCTDNDRETLIQEFDYLAYSMGFPTKLHSPDTLAAAYIEAALNRGYTVSVGETEDNIGRYLSAVAGGYAIQIFDTRKSMYHRWSMICDFAFDSYSNIFEKIDNNGWYSAAYAIDNMQDAISQFLKYGDIDVIEIVAARTEDEESNLVEQVYT